MLLPWRMVSREGLSPCAVGGCEFELSLKISRVSVGQDAMLPVYYRERGWDEEGVPTEEKLAELGLASM